MHGRRLLLILLACLALPAGLALADGEDDTTFDGDGAVYLSAGNDVSEPIVARAADGDLLVGTVISRSAQGNNRGDDPNFDVEMLVYKLDDDGGLDESWGGDGIASGEFEGFGNSTSQALALRGLADGGAILVADDSGEDSIAALRLDSSGDGTVIRPDGLLGCSQSPELAEIHTDGDVLAFWDNSCVGPTNPCAGSRRGGGTCEEIGRARYQRYDLSGGTLDPQHIPHGIGLRPLGDDMFIDDVAVDASGRPSVLGDVIPAAAGRGSRSEDTVILRFEADDDPDPSLDDDGVRVLEGGGFEDTYTGRFGLRPGGGYVVALDGGDFDDRGSDTTWELARLEVGGGLDPDFGDGGFAEPSHEAFTCDYPQSVRVLADEHVLLFRDAQNDGDCADAALVARTTAAGGLDPAFDVDGVRLFDFGGSNVQLRSTNGDPLPYADGRVVLPFFLSYFPTASRIAPPTADGQYLALFRLKGPAVKAEEQKPAVTPVAVTPAAAAPVAGAAPARVAAPRRCLSRRSLTLRLRTGRRRSEQSSIRSVSVTVNGKKVRSTRRGASVNLRNLPKGRYTVVINLRLADGGRVRDVRRYRTCAAKIERELAPLRTRPPRT